MKTREERKSINYPIKEVNINNKFTANIFCREKTKESYKLRLAVLWAVENKKSLKNTYLAGANLNFICLYGMI